MSLRPSIIFTALLYVVACGGDPQPVKVGQSPEDDTGIPDMGRVDMTASDTGGADAPDATDIGDRADLGAQCPTTGPDEPGVVLVDQGPVRGLIEDGVVSFLGVPYAEPPVGDLRWVAPQSPSCFAATHDADTWPSKCAQAAQDGGGLVGSEDCLYLNIWAPENAADAPVLVFVHGGGNMFGSTSEEVAGVRLYEGDELARRSGAIVVTLQYRLNIFGFAVDDVLDEDAAGGSSGNYGIRDQVAALEWLQSNIDAFGGSPDRVLLFGESGGASDVCAHVASPMSAGLFNAAIVQSGGCGGSNRDRVRSWTEETFAAAGCVEAPDRLECLRGLTAEEAIDAMRAQTTAAGVAMPPVGPTIGDDVVPVAPLAAFQAGDHNRVPVVFGSNADETATGLFGIPQDLTAAQYEATLRAILGPRADDALARYPADAFGTPRDSLVRVTTDVQFTCPKRRYARAVAESGAPTYRYFYTKVLDQLPATRRLGAGHGIELYHIFQKFDEIAYPGTAADFALEEAMMKYWVALADGDPNLAAGLPSWEGYDASIDPYLELGDSVVGGSGVRTSDCDFWDEL